MKGKLFQYAILWHPTEKQEKEDGLKSKVLVELKTILASDFKNAGIIAAMDIPLDKRDDIDQLEVIVSSF